MDSCMVRHQPLHHDVLIRFTMTSNPFSTSSLLFACYSKVQGSIVPWKSWKDPHSSLGRCLVATVLLLTSKPVLLHVVYCPSKGTLLHTLLPTSSHSSQQLLTFSMQSLTTWPLTIPSGAPLHSTSRSLIPVWSHMRWCLRRCRQFCRQQGLQIKLTRTTQAMISLQLPWRHNYPHVLQTTLILLLSMHWPSHFLHLALILSQIPPCIHLALLVYFQTARNATTWGWSWQKSQTPSLAWYCRQVRIMPSIHQ